MSRGSSDKLKQQRTESTLMPSRRQAKWPSRSLICGEFTPGAGMDETG